MLLRAVVITVCFHLLCVQNQLWAVGEEASCPFKHHSRASLCQLLQPSSEFVLRKICSLADAGDYGGACRFHLESLLSETSSDVCSRPCSSSYIAVKSTVCETVGAEHTADQQNDMEVEETSDSGYDSAQSYQPVHEDNSTSVTSSQSSESTDVDSRSCLNKTRLSSNTQNASVVMSHAHQCCDCDAVVPSELVSSVIYNLQDHIVGANCDPVPRKLHAPVDFYASFNSLLTGLQCHAVP